MAKNDALEQLQQENLLLREEVERLSTPPYVTGTILDIGTKTIRLAADSGGVYDIAYQGRLKKELKDLVKKGKRVSINPQSHAIVDATEFQNIGGEVSVVEEIDTGRLRIQSKGEPRYVANILTDVKIGDEVLLDGSGSVAIERFERRKSKYALEEIPNAPWTNIGGLESVIAQIRTEVEEPFIHREVFEKYGRGPVKGILLYGPPGCGKTMIAKSIAHNLSKLSNGNGKGHFIQVKGPEILEKWLGNSEANVRRIYAAARDATQDSHAPVVVFIDEAESVLKTRGTGISTDAYDSIVPQFLAEMDGMNGNGNVITVLATNREDIIDPAILRDGRVDRRIRIPRPDKQGAKEIFQLYLKGKPFKTRIFRREDSEKLATEIASSIYDGDHVMYSVVHPREGVLGNFQYRHVMSGAMVKGMVDRACTFAIKREIEGGDKGLTKVDLESAVAASFAETDGFAQALALDDWKDVFGSQGRTYRDACNAGYLVLERIGGGKYDAQTKSQGGTK